MHISRRRFLAATALGLGGVPRFLVRAAEQVEKSPDENILVVLQLSGGNDGLNTVVPFQDPVYHESRPTLAVPRGAALQLRTGGDTEATGAGAPSSADLGFHPAMRALHELYQQGSVAVIQGVGYPNPSRSHFRSMDIWHTARPEVEDATTGWLGNAVARQRGKLPALDVGDDRLPLALWGDAHVPTLQNLDWLDYLSTADGRTLRSRLQALNDPAREGRKEWARTLARDTLADLEHIIALRNRPTPVDYPDSRLAEGLRWVGQLIGGGFGARIYYLTLGGFDTHAQQKDAHAQLLGRLSDAVAAFHRHVTALGASHRVTLVAFSEFGRRVRENGSLGTDHGVANPVLVVSGRARGGLHGSHPRLDDLDEGDLRHGIDFRAVYATLLEDVLGVPSEPILGAKFASVPFLSATRTF